MSEIINTATIKVEVDAAGVDVGLRKIEDSATKTGRTLDNLSKSDGFGKLGAGAEVSASKFGFSGKQIIDSIQKQLAAAERGTKGTREFFEVWANQKGINPAVMKPYLDQLDAVTRKTALATEAQRKADEGAKFIEGLRARNAELGKSASELAAMRAAQLGVSETAGPLIERLRAAEEAAGGFGGSLGLTTGALASFAAGLVSALSITAFVAGVSQAIDVLADLDDMAQKSGSSVETLSRLQKVAAMTGQDFGTVDAAINKLAKGMGGLDDDSNKVNNALKRLGVSSKDAAGNLRDPAQVMIDAAFALQKYADGAGKTALSNELLGKSGADLLPFLNDVTDNVGKFAGASAASAASASAFGDNMGELRVRVGELGTVVASNLLPYLVQFSEYVKELASSEKFKSFIAGAGSAIATFASAVLAASSAIAPAAKIAAAYFVTFVAVPTIVAAASAALATIYGVVGAIAVSFATGTAAAGIFSASLFGTAVAANAAAGGLFTLKTAAMSLFAAFAGWQIGTYLAENFVEARIAGLAFVGAIMSGWEHLKYGALIAWESIGFAWDKTIATMQQAFAAYLSGVQMSLNAFGAEKAAAKVGEFVEALRTASSGQKTFAERTAGITAAHDAEIAAINENITSLVAYELGLGKVAVAKDKAGKPIAKTSLGTALDSAGIAKEAAAYASLIGSIHEKIAANNLELAGGAALSESQKASIKLDQDLASGKLHLSAAHIAAARGALEELAAIEKLLKLQQGEKNTLGFITQSTQARVASTAALELEYALYGKSADARDIANVALKVEAELQKHLFDQAKAGIPVTDEMLEQLREEARLRTGVEQATLAQSKAIGYAAQLKKENEKFAAEGISDPRTRAAALLEIDAKVWQERVAMAAQGSAARKMIEEEYATWHQNQSKKSYLSADVTKANEALTIMSALDDVARRAAEGMERAFGRAGKAIGGMTTAMTAYGKEQAAIIAQRAKALNDSDGSPAKVREIELQSSRALAKAQIGQYAEMTNAASGFFSEQSKGYQALQAASKVFHAAELAMTLAELIPKGVSAVLGQGQGDPYSAFARMAAMAAIVAGLGVAISGGASAGGVSAAEAQGKQGAGSVFGDSGAKSASISKSLDRIEKSTFQGLGYSAGMLDSLRNIEASMSGLANLIIRVPGLANGEGLGIKTGQLNAVGSPTDGISRIMTEVTKGIFGPGLGNKISGFINNLWGKVTANIVDSGIKFGGSVNDLQAGKGFEQYASVNTTKSSFFGLSKKTNNSVQTQGLNGELSNQFGLIFKGLEETLKVAAVGMGLGADEVAKTLDRFVLQTTTLSLKDLKGDDLTAAINGVISKAMDDISSAAFPSFEQFRKIGEGYAETVIRVATDFQAINVVFESFGKVFGKLGLESIIARERLIEMSGGLENFVSQGEYFLVNFFSEQEQADALKKRIQPTLSQYGLSTEGPNATKVFRDFVVALDTTTEAGAKAYVALQLIAPAFTDIVKASQAALDERQSLQDQLDELTMSSAQLLTRQRLALDASNRGLFDQIQGIKALREAQEASKTSLSDMIGKMKSFGDSARTLRDGLLLGSLSTLTPQQQYEEARRQRDATRAAAMGGDTVAQSNLSAMQTAFLTISQKVNGGDSVYSADLAGVIQTSDEIAKWSAGQIDVAQASLNALNAQVIGLSSLNTSVLDVVRAVESLPTALVSPPQMPNYSTMGTASMEPLVAEIKALRQEVTTLRAEQKVQTGDQINAAAQIAAKSTAGVVDAVAATTKTRASASNSTVNLA